MEKLEGDKTGRNVLVAYYSKGGNTRVVAERISKSLDADLDEITLENGSNNKAAFEADPSHYDMVVVGTPVNGFSPSKLVIDYLLRNRGRFNKLATYLTYSLWPAGTLKRMGELASTKPFASAVFKSRDIKLNQIDDRLNEYIDLLNNEYSKR